MKHIWQLGIAMALACAINLSGVLSGPPAARAAVPTIPGIWCSRESGRALSTEQQQLLARSLRRLTGWAGVHFSARGSLALEEAAGASGGSAVARQVLAEVLQSGLVFVIEDHSGSEAINFGQLDEGLIYDDGQGTVMIWHIRLDFGDFRNIGASPEVRASFDEGFALLHEMLHGLGLKDAARAGEVGECESVLNRVRAELGLPLRDDYFGQALPAAPGVIIARLRFKSRDPRRRKWHYLYFLPGRGTLKTPAP